MDDHYQILGVPEDAISEDIEAAYRRLALEHHPDLNPGDQQRPSQRVAINLAYEILSNEKARTSFDDVRGHESRSTSETLTADQMRAHSRARERYNESEQEARERVKKWFYERLGVRPKSRRTTYRIQRSGAALDDLLVKIRDRLGDKLWEFRVRLIPASDNTMCYKIRIVLDPRKCGFRECHLDWTDGYLHGIFAPGTEDDRQYNAQLARSWLSDILGKETPSFELRVFFGVVGGTQCPWRCYLNMSVTRKVSALDIFLQSSVPGLTKYAKENIMDVGAVFDRLAGELSVTPAQLFHRAQERKALARKAENVLRGRHGKRILKEFS